MNYGLVRIVPPQASRSIGTRRPFVIVDPRAGHGPGIGGFKADSEIGVALKAGHPCYFVGFLPDPMPGQTIEDIARAEAVFLEKVIALHPEADGKPCVIGNCQAGWAVMMLAAIRPELFGPIIIAGSPLSYWAGVHGKNPDALQRRPAGRQLADRADQRSRQRQVRWRLAGAEFREPESGEHAVEQAIQPLFQDRYRGAALSRLRALVGRARQPQCRRDPVHRRSSCSSATIWPPARSRPRTARTIDLRNIRSPIVVFCSKGDNITPPQQALGWILDLYDDVDEIRAYGQTIVYTIHETVGHLGIFVSGGVARKQHDEFSSNIDLIDTSAAGSLRGHFRSARRADTANADLVSGDWVMRCEARTLDDIRALGGNDAGGRTAVRGRSRCPRSISRSIARSCSLVRALVSRASGGMDAQLHPLRLPTSSSPTRIRSWRPSLSSAEHVREDRKPAAPDNPFFAMQENVRARSSPRSTLGGMPNEAIAEQHVPDDLWFARLQAAVGIDPAARSRAQSGKERRCIVSCRERASPS